MRHTGCGRCQMRTCVAFALLMLGLFSTERALAGLCVGELEKCREAGLEIRPPPAKLQATLVISQPPSVKLKKRNNAKSSTHTKKRRTNVTFRSSTSKEIYQKELKEPPPCRPPSFRNFAAGRMRLCDYF